MKAINALLWLLGAVAATADVAHRRLVCLRRGYHRVLDPAGTSCLDCWLFLE